MTNISLAQSYLIKAMKRLKILPVLLAEQAYSDVVREAQEIVKLALKGMLRQAGVDPPKWHDVGAILVEQKHLFPAVVQKEIPKLTVISKWLRRERELSFYGDIDFIPTEEYVKKDAQKAIRDANFTARIVGKVVKLP
jgi:HEPN domain-containing protein